MADEDHQAKRYLVDPGTLPKAFPTNRHSPLFWEWLGRTIGSFGFLEETLGKAIFALTGTRSYSEERLSQELEKWIPTLERALYETLYPLIEVFAKAAREHPDLSTTNLDELVADLKTAAALRNVLCHGSWSAPDANGASIPLFVAKKGLQRFEAPIDIPYLQRTQRHVAELTASVINVVTRMGWQFPGSAGPGKPVY